MTYFQETKVPKTIKMLAAAFSKWTVGPLVFAFQS